MNTIRRIFFGENIRQSLEGLSTQDIIEIVRQDPLPPETSPFAKVVGIHLSAKGHDLAKNVSSGSYKKGKSKGLTRRRS
jgi:hypothetical protein